MKEYFELRTGRKIPAVGLGTGKLGLNSNPEEFDKVIENALDIGYRHFDSATRYGNENLLGSALKKWTGNDQRRRDELFIVTKLPVNGMHKDFVAQFLEASLKRLQMDYVDLYLIHWPIGLQFVSEDNFVPRNKTGSLLFDLSTNINEIWEAMESMVDCGKAKAIGLSNFNQEQIKRIVKSCRIPPANLQVEVHAYFQQKSLREFCTRNDIQICAYAPLASPFRQNYPNAADLNIPALLDDPIVLDIARLHEKSAAQVLLRYLVQGLSVAVIPKTCNVSRLRENIEIFDFELTSTDLERLSELDRGENGRTWNAFDG
ncbi:Alcohol dehydrogenase [NADP(+)] [Orchesella cincta]|uniref:Alcohol dehydrogenase [NADP(+)] n=1 Tax=Orchesella cincta TaxID=48709 RepID=A0A1D2MZD4_ORCCI|nr:Alcohol dehydrogenase [NADP(+)] [Orchesella cincta]